MLPAVNLRPPFNITRASHVVLHVSDLAKSRDFYVNIVGLVVSEQDDGVCYLRGLAEACHHSLVLVQSPHGADLQAHRLSRLLRGRPRQRLRLLQGRGPGRPNGSTSRIRGARSTWTIRSAPRSSSAPR